MRSFRSRALSQKKTPRRGGAPGALLDCALSLLIQEADRVHRKAIHVYLIVEVRAGRAPRIPHLADHVPLLHGVAHLDHTLRKVGVKRPIAVPVVDPHDISIKRLEAAPDHLAPPARLDPAPRR